MIVVFSKSVKYCCVFENVFIVVFVPEFVLRINSMLYKKLTLHCKQTLSPKHLNKDCKVIAKQNKKRIVFNNGFKILF